MADLARDRCDLRRLVRRRHARTRARLAADDRAACALWRVVSVVAARIAARASDALAVYQRIDRLYAARGMVSVPGLSRTAFAASRRSASDAPGAGSGKLF